MLFSSADFPIFLLAVCLLYAEVGAGRRPHALREAARIALAIALGDVIYLLLCKRADRLWDPLGPALAALLGAARGRGLVAPAALARFALGLVAFAAALRVGERQGPALDGERAQTLTARAVTAGLTALALALLVAHRASALDALAESLARVGHLAWLGLLGLAVGASRHTAGTAGTVSDASGDGDGRPTARRLVLLAASMVFYHAWAAEMTGAYRFLLGLIVATIALDYALGRWIADVPADRPRARRALVALSLAANLGVLVAFKYYDFLVANLVAAGALAGLAVPLRPVALVLPAGISFHTFQSLSYTLDVAARGLRPTRSLVRFATFVLFFPQLVAGPIVRAEDFLPQLAGGASPGLAGRGDPPAAAGLLRIALGLAKKLVVADVLAVTLVDRAFAHPARYSGLECLAERRTGLMPLSLQRPGCWAGP